MPKQKKFKEKVRARQERDGVSYSEAHRIEHGEHKCAEMTPVQEDRHRREEAFREWLRNNPGVHEVKLRLQYNEYGTPQVAVTVQPEARDPVTITVTRPPLVYAEAIRQGIADWEWAQDPSDDLGDLPECSSA